jgi:hypothetical protein
VGDRPERQLIWHRSQHCEGGACAEVASDGENVLLRESGSRENSLFTIGLSKWREFLARVKDDFNSVETRP